MIDWKGKVKMLVDQFSEKKGAMTPLSEPDPEKLHLIQITPDEHLLEVEGSSINAKSVRKWLWELRNQRCVQRKNAFLFASYDESDDISRVGLGAFTTADAAVRLTNMRKREVS
jgi:hypothetical protein